jgi:hypothetical protein
MSSSRSSEEDNSKKKPAAELAEEVRGRAIRKAATSSEPEGSGSAVENHNAPLTSTRHTRSKSASFASILIDQAHKVDNEPSSISRESTSLLSEPARPQTSIAAGVDVPSPLEWRRTFSSPQQQVHTLSKVSKESAVHKSKLGAPNLPTIFESISSWLPWSKNTDDAEMNAEGSLRELLKSTDVDKKGKGPGRLG